MSLAATDPTQSPNLIGSHTHPGQVAMPMISKQLIRQRFDKACQSYQTHNDVQKRIAQTLLEMMATQAATGPVLLDLGCGPGPDWQALCERCRDYIGVDLSAAMLAAHESRQQQLSTRSAQLVQADMESLPLPTASVDTLYSSMAMQWADCRQSLCKELRRVLKPGGFAFVSVPLQGSLQPLAQIRQSIDGQSQVNPQPIMQDWIASWESAGFNIEHAQQACFTEYYTGLKSLLQSIKGVGAGANQAIPLTRKTLLKLASGYEQARTERGLPLEYQVGLMHLKRT